MAAVNLLLGTSPIWAGASGSITFVNFTLDATTDTIEYIFQAPAAGIVITHLGFRYASRTGTVPTYRISLQGVTDGLPDGTIKGGGSPASATFTPPASTAWNNTWQWIALANSYTTVSRGEPLAIVIDYSSGTINASNCGQWSDSVNGFHGRVAFPYSIENNAGVRNRSSQQPLFGYKSASVTYGQPWNTFTQTQYSSNSNPNEYGMRFIMPDGSVSSYKVAGIRARITTPAAAKTFDMNLYEGTTLLQAITIDSDSLRINAQDSNVIDYYFDEATLSTLTPGTVYYASFLSNTTSSNLALAVAVANNAQDAAVNGDGNCWLATRNGGAWTETTSTRPLMDLILGDISGGSSGRIIGGGF